MTDMLDNFLNDKDFPQQTIYIYNYSSTLDTSTGVMTKGYKLQEIRDVWIFSSSIAKSLFTDKVMDTLDAVLITDEALDSTDIINYGNTWYSCKISDDILFSGQVVQIGLAKIPKPDILDEVAEDEVVLGDSIGLL